MDKKYPYIFDIYRGSLIDGPGIRTVVFFTGCPLRCAWCQNPESWSFNLSTTKKTMLQLSPEELVENVCRDIVYFNTSGGGVTFSGGEPLLYPEYLYDVCLLFKGRGIHCAVETSGYFDEYIFSLGLDQLIDLFLFDIKIIDSAEHIKATGKSNDRIFDNLRRLVSAGRPVCATIPLIPGYTATNENLSNIAALLVNHGIERYELMPYNPSCIDKQKKLGIEADPLLRGRPLSIEEESFLRNYFHNLISNNSVNTISEARGNTSLKKEVLHAD